VIVAARENILLSHALRNHVILSFDEYCCFTIKLVQIASDILFAIDAMYVSLYE